MLEIIILIFMLVVAFYFVFYPYAIAQPTEKCRLVFWLNIASLVVWPLWIVAFAVAVIARNKFDKNVAQS